MLLAPQLSHLVRTGSYVFSDNYSGRMFSDASSVKSLASIGVGSTDGRKMFIRKVPNTTSELLSYLHPQTWVAFVLDITTISFKTDNRKWKLCSTREPWSSTENGWYNGKINYQREAINWWCDGKNGKWLEYFNSEQVSTFGNDSSSALVFFCCCFTLLASLSTYPLNWFSTVSALRCRCQIQL